MYYGWKVDANGFASKYKQYLDIGMVHTLTDEGWSKKPFYPLLAPLAPLAPRDLQNELCLPQTNMTTYKATIIK